MWAADPYPIPAVQIPDKPGTIEPRPGARVSRGSRCAIEHFLGVGGSYIAPPFGLGCGTQISAENGHAAEAIVAFDRLVVLVP